MAKKGRRKRSVLKQKFTLRMQKKLVMLFMAVLLAFTVLIGRITYINASNGEEYARTVLDQQQYTSQTIPFKRGDITDRNGTRLATSERVYNVILDAKVLLDDEDKAEEYIKATEEALETYLEIDPDTVEQVLEESPDSRYTILKKDVDYETAMAYQDAVEDDTSVQGVWLEEDYLRTYPYGNLASTITGFTVDGNVGAAGLEAEYNYELNGTDGREYGYQNADTGTETTVKEAVNGNSITTTIDANLQSIVEKHIRAFNDSHKDEAQDGEGSKNTAVIIMDPNNGEILAEAVYPDYNLNSPRDLSAYYSEEEISAMSSEDKLAALNSLWNNFCVNTTYEPGSTVKPFTIAAALETGVLKGDETFYCGGSLHVGDYDIRCISYDEGGHGTQNLTQVMENSCNVALMQIGLQLGAEEFGKYQNIFGFGSYTGIDLPGEEAGLLYSPDDMGDTDLATNSFGQNFNVTMTQLVAGFCSLINGGNYYEPHIVKSIQDANGNVIETKEAVLEKRTVSQETSELLKSYMYSVVENGSGVYAQVDGYDIGGKTGTAEKLPRGENKNLLSFIGYAPQDNPEVVVYVVVDEPNVAYQAGISNQVSQLAADIMAEAFPYLNITQSTAQE